jgi:hypothetical protein
MTNDSDVGTHVEGGILPTPSTVGLKQLFTNPREETYYYTKD